LLAPLSRVSGVSIADRQLKQVVSLCGCFSVPAVVRRRFHRDAKLRQRLRR
jgi:hypothetical protein